MPYIVDNLIQLVAESDATFTLRVQTYINDQHFYWNTVGGSFTATVGTPAFIGYPPISPTSDTFEWDSVNLQFIRNVTFSYENTYYYKYLGISPAPPSPPPFPIVGDMVIFGSGGTLVDSGLAFDMTAMNWTNLAPATVAGQAVEFSQLSGVGTVTNVTGTSPVVSSGGITPAISIPAATGGVSGYLSGTDWSTFNNKGNGSVTSVAASVPTFLSVSGSPITTSGTLAVTLSGTALPVLNGGTGVTTSTGSGNSVLSTSPTLVTPILGSASATALTFTSTAVSGSTINKLTTAQRQALTPVIGDVVCDTTIGTTCTYNGTFWEYNKEYYVTANVTTTSSAASTITGLTTFVLESNSTYNINGQFLVQCNGAGGVKFGNSMPSGAVSSISYFGTGTGLTTIQQVPNNNGSLTATAVNRFSGVSYLIFSGLITTAATSGSVTMQFASTTVGQTSTINGLFSSAFQSKITLTKIA